MNNSPIRQLRASFRRPRKSVFIGDDSSGKSRPVIAAPSHQHDAELGHIPASFDSQLFGSRRHLKQTNKIPAN